MRSGFPKSPTKKKDDLSWKNGNKGREEEVGDSQLALKGKERDLEKAVDWRLSEIRDVRGSQVSNTKDALRSILPRENRGNGISVNEEIAQAHVYETLSMERQETKLSESLETSDASEFEQENSFVGDAMTIDEEIRSMGKDSLPDKKTEK
ncbi:hypothetical protein ACH5RR_000487 [Cinchona calisaya]|uniref:Uncharacterized protein n=1 Tax=Cinchona calisaya TaxID=153742 RepID=A0ABD3B0Z9_9GENT